MEIKKIQEIDSTPLEVLVWVGCAGAFDDRYQKVTVAFTKLLALAGVQFAVLGEEESCTGEPAKRAGNEFLFQMQAMQNIGTLNKHGVKKIVTSCPHCFHTLKNEYPDLGGKYQVYHHSTYLQQLIEEGRLSMEQPAEEVQVSYHDSCYLGRANGEYESPRSLLRLYSTTLLEMRKNKSKSTCCGAGGAQMFKEDEKGDTSVNIMRTQEALATGAKVIASACPFCMTMLRDGVKNQGKEEEVLVKDVAELLLERAEKKTA